MHARASPWSSWCSDSIRSKEPAGKKLLSPGRETWKKFGNVTSPVRATQSFRSAEGSHAAKRADLNLSKKFEDWDFHAIAGSRGPQIPHLPSPSKPKVNSSPAIANHPIVCPVLSTRIFTKNSLTRPPILGFPYILLTFDGFKGLFGREQQNC